jgi:hypothetical protein
MISYRIFGQRLVVRFGQSLVWQLFLNDEVGDDVAEVIISVKAAVVLVVVVAAAVFVIMSLSSLSFLLLLLSFWGRRRSKDKMRHRE